MRGELGRCGLTKTIATLGAILKIVEGCFNAIGSE